MNMTASRHIYTLKKPASWYGEMWREALPLGNGLTGALIPGSIAEEKIQFNRHDLWHGGSPGGEIPDVSDVFRSMREAIDRGDYAAANRENLGTALRDNGYGCSCEVPYPLGWLKLHFVPDGMFRHYLRGVDMRTGEAFVTFEIDGCSFRRDMFVSRDSDIAVLRMRADRAFETTVDFELFGETEEKTAEENGFTRSSGETAARVRIVGAEKIVRTGDALTVTGRDYRILIRCSSHGSPLDLDEYAQESYGSLLEKHAALHRPLYDAVSVELADDEAHGMSNEEMLDEAYDDRVSPAFLERLWRFGRYLFLSAASEKGNPVPLYGLWHGGDGLQWSQYVANENVEITYWHTMAGGLSYAVIPLLRYYASKIAAFRACAKKLFGADGIWISAYTTPNVAGPSVPVGVIIDWISCAGWLCRHFWEYYLYTGDTKLLREEILPFMHEAALFFQSYAVEENGAIRLYPSVSPENTPSNLFDLPTVTWTGHPCSVTENATMDFAVMKELLTNLLAGIDITEMYADEAAGFRDLLSKIPPYQINEDGAVKEWMRPELKDNYNHRHLSHIYPVFPGKEVTEQSDPVLFEAFRRAVKLRVLGSQCNWSLVHMASIYARFGEAEKAAECVDLLAKSVELPSLFTVCNDWRHMGMTLDWDPVPVQLDGTFGVVNAVQETLFCAGNGSLSILPACPARLTSGRVRGIRFPEGTVDFEWSEDGTVSAVIRAEREMSETGIFVKGQDCGSLRLRAGESRHIRFPL